MMKQVVAAAGDGVHTLAFDGVVPPGRLQDEFMARYRVIVVNKPKAAEVKKGTMSARQILVAQVKAQHARPGARELTPRELDVAVNRVAEQLWERGHLPAGLAIYPTTEGFDVVDSRVDRFEDAHPGAGDGHRDRFLLDDETLYLADPDDPDRKGAYCPPLDSIPEGTEYGTWARRTHWQVPCPDGAWTLERLWTPNIPTGVLGLAERREQKVVALMDPVPRRAETFRAATRRSTAESANNFVENTMAHYGRANHRDPNRQLLSYYGANKVLNAITWQHHPDSLKPWQFRLSAPPVSD